MRQTKEMIVETVNSTIGQRKEIGFLPIVSCLFQRPQLTELASAERGQPAQRFLCRPKSCLMSGA